MTHGIKAETFKKEPLVLYMVKRNMLLYFIVIFLNIANKIDMDGTFQYWTRFFIQMLTTHVIEMGITYR